MGWLSPSVVLILFLMKEALCRKGIVSSLADGNRLESACREQTARVT